MEYDLEQEPLDQDPDELGGLPPPPPVPDAEQDPKNRFKEYLQAQMAVNQRRQSPEYQASRDEQSGKMDGLKGDIGLGSLLMDSAAKFGMAGGQQVKSDYGTFAKGQQDLVAQAQAGQERRSAQDDAMGSKQTQLMKYLADQQNLEKNSEIKRYIAETQRKKLDLPNYASPGQDAGTGAWMALNKKTGKMDELGPGSLKKEKPERVTYRPDDNLIDEASGRPLLVGSDGTTKVLEGAARKEKPKKDGYDGLPKDKQTMVQDLQKANASKLSIVNQIDAELNNFKDFTKKGNQDQAITAGENMLKVLNSTEGKDAVGAEEAKRLAGFLKFNILNLSNPGPTFGRDLDQFYTQASSKSNSIKGAIRANQKNIDDLMAGTYDPTKIPDLPTEIGASTEGTATAATGGKQIVKQQYSPSRNQTRITYSDGTTEVKDGR